MKAGISSNVVSLMEACSKGDTETVRTLLEKGAKVNAKNNMDLTALMIAKINGHTETVQALLAVASKFSQIDLIDYDS